MYHAVEAPVNNAGTPRRVPAAWAGPTGKANKEKIQMKLVVFVDQEDTAHSVIAAAVCNRMAERWRLAGLWAQSAGLSVQEGEATAPAAVQAAREFGIELSPHCARGLTQALIEQASLLVALNRPDYEALLKLAPMEKVYLMQSGKALFPLDIWACRRSVDQAFDGFQELWRFLRGRV